MSTAARPKTQPSITCPQCRRTSYHAEDIRQKYCGACHMFHSEIKIMSYAPHIVERRFREAVQNHGRYIDKAIVGGVERYVLQHIKTGDMLYGMLIDDLWTTIMHASMTLGAEDLRAILRFVYDAVPAESRGSEAAVEAWLALDAGETEDHHVLDAEDKGGMR